MSEVWAFDRNSLYRTFEAEEFQGFLLLRRSKHPEIYPNKQSEYELFTPDGLHFIDSYETQEELEKESKDYQVLRPYWRVRITGGQVAQYIGMEGMAFCCSLEFGSYSIEIHENGRIYPIGWYSQDQFELISE